LATELPDVSSVRPWIVLPTWYVIATLAMFAATDRPR
jgi:hypothetical protein